MKSGKDLVNEAKERIHEVDPKEALAAHEHGGATFLDVRDLQEVNLGRIPGAVHISRGSLENKVEAIVPRDTPLVLYCGGGSRSSRAASAAGRKQAATSTDDDGRMSLTATELDRLAAYPPIERLLRALTERPG